MTSNTELVARITLLETAIAGIAAGLGISQTLGAELKGIQDALQHDNVPANSFRLVDLLMREDAAPQFPPKS